MPPFSPCGLAVEWVRSCHHGYWRFFGNRPEKLTGGQFYRLPAGSPHLKTPHLFFTSDWTKGDRRAPNQLGEVPGVEWVWKNGALRGRIPPQVPVGRMADFEADWQYPPITGPRTNRCGIDSRCYTNVGSPFVDESCLAKLDSTAVQMVYCQLVKLLYDADDAKITAFIECWFGPHAVLTIYPLEGLLPAMLIVQTTDVSLVVISGTDGFQQIALQGLQHLLGPTDYGEYSTLPLWHNTATTVFNRMIACGVAGPEPLVLAGHSYGAAVCTIIATRVRLASADRHVYMFNFGKPRSGDARMRAILASVPTVELCNVEDIVTQLPPSGEELEPFRVLLGPALYSRWNRWRNFTEQLVMDVGGNQTLVPPRSLAFNLLAPIIANALAGLPEPFVPTHTAEEYIRRLARTALPDECCVDQPCWGILFPLPAAPFGVMAAGGGELGGNVAGGGGVELGGGGGVPDLLAGGGVELGGDVGQIEEKGSGGPELGGESDFDDLVGAGGVELGGDVGQIAQKGSGGVELGDVGDGPGEYEGEGGITLGSADAPPAPGNSCATAGSIPFNTLVGGTVAVGIVHDWWTFTSVNGKTYTLTFTQVTATPAANLDNGTCSSLTIQKSFFFTGTDGYTEGGATQPGYIDVFYPGFFGTADYTLFLTET